MVELPKVNSPKIRELLESLKSATIYEDGDDIVVSTDKFTARITVKDEDLRKLFQGLAAFRRLLG